MKRTIQKLTSNEVIRASARGYYGDGGGLYLQVSQSGAKSWVFRYRVNGRLREMGLGAAAVPDAPGTVTLVDARKRAYALREQLARKEDPIEIRKAEQIRAKLENAKQMTFRQCAEAYIGAHAAEWRNARHAGQWPSTLADYVYPTFGDLPAQAIDVALVMRVLRPIWSTKRETASRVRGRIESILDWAATAGYRTGENPARWRGHLENLLSKKTKIQKPHLASVPYAEVAEFMARLRQVEGVAARALEFTILTASRTGEVLGARWEEINLAERIWTVPAERMKGGFEHRVPLPANAVALIGSGSGFVFNNRNRPLPSTAMIVAMKGLRPETVHGFRSTFSTWAADNTTFSKEIREAALAHRFGDAETYRAYQRSDLLERRRELMEAWSRWCDGQESAPLRLVGGRQ
jgi:integrase